MEAEKGRNYRKVKKEVARARERERWHVGKIGEREENRHEARKRKS